MSVQLGESSAPYPLFEYTSTPCYNAAPGLQLINDPFEPIVGFDAPRVAGSFAQHFELYLLFIGENPRSSGCPNLKCAAVTELGLERQSSYTPGGFSP